MLTQQVALDFSPLKIRSNVVCPGAVKSMTENPKASLSDEKLAQIDKALTNITKYSPLRRAGTPAEIAGVCSFLASDDSSFMTGAVLMVDGGASIVDVNGVEMIAAGKKWGFDR